MLFCFLITALMAALPPTALMIAGDLWRDPDYLAPPDSAHRVVRLGGQHRADGVTAVRPASSTSALSGALVRAVRAAR